MTTESNTYLVTLKDNMAATVTADYFEDNAAGFYFRTELPDDPVAFFSHLLVESIVKQPPLKDTHSFVTTKPSPLSLEESLQAIKDVAVSSPDPEIKYHGIVIIDPKIMEDYTAGSYKYVMRRILSAGGPVIVDQVSIPYCAETTLEFNYHPAYEIKCKAFTDGKIQYRWRKRVW